MRFSERGAVFLHSPCQMDITCLQSFRQHFYIPLNLRAVVLNRPRHGLFDNIYVKQGQEKNGHVITEIDPVSGVLFALNPYNTEFPDRTEFLGRMDVVHRFGWLDVPADRGIIPGTEAGGG